MTLIGLIARARGWLTRWQRVLPILVAEFVLLVGFGALLPILPLYVVEQGVDQATLGVILAAWPAARLGAEPLFGWLADRTARKPLMLAGCLLLAGLTLLPIFFTSAAALIAIRFASGIAASMYDPAARGFLVDSTDEDKRGEVFGLYSAAAMGGLIFGPILGTLGAAFGGGFVFPFVAASAMSLVAAIYLVVALPSERSRGAAGAPHITEGAPVEYGADSPAVASRRATALDADSRPNGLRSQAPLRALLNRMFLGALVMNFGLYFSIGVYEVIWSLYMERLGASLAWIGFTFTLFGLPMLILSPFGGRLVDRVGPRPFAIAGLLIVAAAGFTYTFATEPILPAGIIVIESAANAFLGPAMFAILAVGTPAGRSSTAQGLFGAGGTLAFIISSLAAGWLFSLDPRYPFYFFTAVVVASVVAGALITREGGSARGSSALHHCLSRRP
jgi:DHA1 family multidrug resistance protein-like MFS transporter